MWREVGEEVVVVGLARRPWIDLIVVVGRERGRGCLLRNPGCEGHTDLVMVHGIGMDRSIPRLEAVPEAVAVVGRVHRYLLPRSNTPVARRNLACCS